MTQKKAIIKALEEHGGRATLTEIYPRVIQLAKFKPGSDKKATIRTTLQRNPNTFRPSPGKPKGWWDLNTFQEEIASRDRLIAELKAKLAAKDEEISELKQRETSDFFVDRMIEATKTVFATKRNDARPVQQVLVVMNRPEQRNLMEWILGKTTKKENKNITKKIIQTTINNTKTYVENQTVIPNVENYKPQIQNQNMDVTIPSLEDEREKLLEDE